MTILTKDKLKKEIKKGNIKIEPYNEENVGPASIDLTLDNKFRTYDEKGTIIVDENTDFEKHTKLVETDEIKLKPGGFILGITKEKITLPNDMCGWLQGRSRFARLGLSVHITASFLQPGISNKQVLEIFNANSKTIVLKSGTKICQLIIQKTKGRSKYDGKFKDQRL
ncbi:MAG: dCTP deaminase [Nanoarchaeota archaeon]|nr:dCTP deaminase [Nanoarchaeota archaeon]MBU1270463.1 dCTP deaminase [Nanoarchaeota archaeon]MBU1604073.1 dCTP deaminase [Nanoarchaeota archaeon]MBU2442569.1 dCTP deaminase [Nanoarchaeota archaeon]